MQARGDTKNFSRLFNQLSDNSSRKSIIQKRVAIVLVTILVIFGFYYWIGGALLQSQIFFQKIHNDMMLYPGDSIKWLDLKGKYAVKREEPDPADGAFVFLAMGAQALQMNCPAAVESLVRVAGWKHDIYLLTDREDCFDRDKIVQNAEMEDDKFHLVSVDMDLGSGGVDWEHFSSVGFRRQRVLSFSMKTKLFDYIPDKRIQRVAYVDCDVVFALPGCASQFMNSNEGHWDENPLAVTRAIMSNATLHAPSTHLQGSASASKELVVSELVDVHLGSFVAHRQHSANVMRIWREQVERFTEPGDNDAFMEAYRREERIRKEKLLKLQSQSPGKDKDKKIEVVRNPMEPREVVLQEAGDGVEEMRYEWFYNSAFERPSCFLHISKARCALYGREQVQDLVNLFNLRTYEKQYPYCVNPALQTLLYGWFPVAWLPGCPKFEQYL